MAGTVGVGAAVAAVVVVEMFGSGTGGSTLASSLNNTTGRPVGFGPFSFVQTLNGFVQTLNGMNLQSSRKGPEGNLRPKI